MVLAIFSVQNGLPILLLVSLIVAVVVPITMAIRGGRYRDDHACPRPDCNGHVHHNGIVYYDNAPYDTEACDTCDYLHATPIQSRHSPTHRSPTEIG